MASRAADDASPPKTETGDERRTTPRSLARLGVRFSGRDQLAQAMQATTHNIGLGGLCLLTNKAYQVGTRFELVIELGNEEVLQLSAVVAWSKPGRAVGVRFEGMNEQQRRRIEELVNRHKDTPDNGEGP